MSISRRTGTLALIPVVAWLASIGAAEGAFRALGQRTSSDLAGLYQQFGEGGYKHRPLVRTDANAVYGKFAVFTNDLGLRCSSAEAAVSSRAQPLDVLLVGDSQGFGNGLQYEASLAGQLDAAGARNRITIRNASVGGHYLDNQFEIVRWLYDVQGIHPRAILILMTPYMVATAGAMNHAVVEADGRLYSGHVSGYRSITRWLKMHTVVYAELRDALKGLMPSEVPFAVQFYARSTEPRDSARLRSSLSSLAAWARERRVQLAVVYTPLAAELDFAGIEAVAREDSVPVDRDLPQRVTRTVAGELRIPFYDLRPTLAAEQRAGRALSLYKDPHYNAATSRAAAESIWSALQSGLLPVPLSEEEHGPGRDDATAAGLHP